MAFGQLGSAITQMCIYRLLWSVFTLQQEKMQQKLVDILDIAIKKTNHRRCSLVSDLFGGAALGWR